MNCHPPDTYVKAEQMVCAGLMLSFELPSDRAFRVDITDRKWETMMLYGLDAIYEASGAAYATQEGGIPKAASIGITDTVSGTVLASATNKARKVLVYNSGTKDLVILEGDQKPGFLGQANPNGAGVLPADFGIVLAPGDGYESTVAHKGQVTARSRDTESTVATVIRF